MKPTKKIINRDYLMVIEHKSAGIARHLVGVSGAIEFLGSEDKFFNLYARAERVGLDRCICRPFHGATLTFYLH